MVSFNKNKIKNKIKMENNILEELNRIRLLSKYNNKLTLSENHNIIGEFDIISEAPVPGEAANKLFQTALRSDRALAKSMTDEINVFFTEVKGGFTGGIHDTLGNQLYTGEEVIEAIEKGILAKAELGKVNTKLFRTTKNSGIKTLVAKDMVKNIDFLKAMSQVENETEAIERLVSGPKKFTQEEAEFLVNEYKNTGKGFGESVLKTTTKMESFKNWVKRQGQAWSKLSRTKKILAIAGAGLGVYLLWSYFKDEDPGVFNDCVLSYMTDDDLTKMAQIGFGEGIIISKTPNRQINALGGVKLFTNGDLVSVDDSIKGKWNSSEGSISVNIGGQTFNIPCGKETIPDTGSVDSGNNKPNQRYRDCGSGPFSKGCYEKDRNGPIHKVQSCLGGIAVDGKFWNVTESALMNKTGKNLFTKDEVNTICSQPTPSPTETNPYAGWEPNEPESGDTTGNKQDDDKAEG